LNVNPSEAFDRIEQVQRLPYDAARHRPVAISVRRHAMRLRDFLHRLGRALVPRRARLRGRAFDRTRVRAVVTRRDPRMLVAREIEVANDIFVGTIIDCSSSMQAYDNIEKAKRFGVLVAEAVRDLPGVEARFFGFTERVIFDAGDGGRCAVTSLESQGGNNDAAALYHAARVASGSARRTRVLVMISDGLPTECSVSALRALVGSLGRRGFICAQVAVHPLEEVCFPNYVVLDEKEMDLSVARFGELIMKLVARG
jgi:nitric oxide reductase activation protein